MLEQVISNRAGWTRVTFGEVVRKVNDKVDPWESGLERYVAGDHMDTDDLRIRRWGLIGDDYLGPAFHMRFKPGHVLYGSRRTYLRKVALADFEGVTANTTYVLESKDPSVLLPELLPFIMQTESFHQHSIGRSKGSVNPYINFSDIACFEFLLPPIQEQARIVDSMIAGGELLKCLAKLRTTAETALDSYSKEVFDRVLAQSKMAPLGTICTKKPQSGIYKSDKFRGKGCRFVNMNELFGNDVISEFTPMARVQLSDAEVSKYRLTSDDLLFGRRSIVVSGAGRCVRVSNLIEPVAFESSVLRVTLDSKLANPAYVFEWMRSPFGAQQINRISTFTTVAGVTGSDVARLPIPIISKDQQVDISNRLAKIREQLDPIDERLKKAKRQVAEILTAALEAKNA